MNHPTPTKHDCASQGAPPSGAQYQIEFGDQEVTVVEVGGGLRTYTKAGNAILDGYSQSEPCSGARGEHLIPWPNRLRDGRYSFEGTEHQLPISEPGNNNAIHGLVRWTNWTAVLIDRNEITMSHTLHPQPGWPFTLALEINYHLDRDGLTVRSTATNNCSTACPYGAGSHPYLRVAREISQQESAGQTGLAQKRVSQELIDDLWLQVPARSWLRGDSRGIPQGIETVEVDDYDFRKPRKIGSKIFDTCFTDLTRDVDGLARVTLQAHAASQAEGEAEMKSVELWVDGSYPYIMIFSGDTLAEESKRRQGLAVEPMTCAPNALQSGAGLLTLQPGETFTSIWGIAAG